MKTLEEFVNENSSKLLKLEKELKEQIDLIVSRIQIETNLKAPQKKYKVSYKNGFINIISKDKLNNIAIDISEKLEHYSKDSTYKTDLNFVANRITLLILDNYEHLL